MEGDRNAQEKGFVLYKVGERILRVIAENDEVSYFDAYLFFNHCGYSIE